MDFEKLAPGSTERTAAWQGACGFGGNLDHKVDMLLEELEELRGALKIYRHNRSRETKLGVFDGMGDVGFTMQALCAELGTSLEEVVHRVQLSNEGKFSPGLASAEETVGRYATGTHPDRPGQVIPAYTEMRNGTWMVKRASDGKMLKDQGYRKPDFEDLL